MKKNTINPQLVGEAGVHFVVSALTLKGLIAVATSRNVKGPDVIVTNSDGTWFAAIQVKTRLNTKAKFWNVGDRGMKWGGQNCWYVFVRINNGEFEAFMEKAEKVKKCANADFDDVKKRRKKSFGAAWGFGPYFAKLLGDQKIESRSRSQWKDFGLRKVKKA